jgi:hypothetical protein
MVAVISLKEQVVCIDFHNLGCVYIHWDYYNSYILMMQNFVTRNWRKDNV